MRGCKEEITGFEPSKFETYTARHGGLVIRHTIERSTARSNHVRKHTSEVIGTYDKKEDE